MINPQFESAGDYSLGLASVVTGDKGGFIDTTGRMVISMSLKSSRARALWGSARFSEGFAAVPIGDRWGFIDRTGRRSEERRVGKECRL